MLKYIYNYQNLTTLKRRILVKKEDLCVLGLSKQ